jgi:hypothetical protein
MIGRTLMAEGRIGVGGTAVDMVGDDMAVVATGVAEAIVAVMGVVMGATGATGVMDISPWVGLLPWEGLLPQIPA